LLFAELIVPIPNAPATVPLGAETTAAAVDEIDSNVPTDEAVADAEPGPGPTDMDCEPPGWCPLTVKPVGLFNTETTAPLLATEKPFAPPIATGPAQATVGNKQAAIMIRYDIILSSWWNAPV
jgi:hypothetical protein